MSNAQKPRVLIIAGPNGAGKTTFAREFLPHEADCPVFINADLIAEGISPFDPSSAAISAGRLMLNELEKYGRGEVSFAFETTLSGMCIRHSKSAGIRRCLAVSCQRLDRVTKVT